MTSKHKRIMILIQILLMCSFSSGEQSSSISKSQSKASNPEKVPTVSYYDLIKTPKLVGQLVRVKGRWAYGFEWSLLYDRERSVPPACIVFEKKENLCAGTFERSRKITGENDGQSDVVMVGRLEGGPGQHFGHMGAYSYQFVVTCVEKGKQLHNKVP